MHDLKTHTESALAKLSESFEKLSSTVQELKESQNAGKNELTDKLDSMSKTHAEKLEQESVRIKERLDTSLQSLADGKVSKDKLAEVFSKLAGILTDPK